MPAPVEYFVELAQLIHNAKSAEERDQLLDEWHDVLTRATDYDAEEWGFDSKRWMSEARQLMETRIREQRSMQRSKR